VTSEHATPPDDEAQRSVVEVFHAEVRPVETVERSLGAEEIARLARLRSDDDRARYATAHALLRAAVARWTTTTPEELVFDATCRRCGGPHGRPELRSTRGTGLHVSLSRSGPEVLVAVTRLGPVGVDGSAPVADDFEGFDGVALSHEERHAIAELAPAERPRGRAVLWTRKEAVLKATGHGLMVSPNLVEVSPPFTTPGLVRWLAREEAPTNVQLLDLALPGSACGAVAVLSARSPDLVVRRGEPLFDLV
jgi:4'-phosphopantetheinyl transferase